MPVFFISLDILSAIIIVPDSDLNEDSYMSKPAGKAIEDAAQLLAQSIERFVESSAESSIKLNQSIKRFEESSAESSKKMVSLTKGIFFLTVVLLFLVIVQIILAVYC